MLLTEEIAIARKAETESRKDNVTVREEKEKTIEKYYESQKEIELLNIKNNSIRDENNLLKADIMDCRLRLNENESKLLELEKEYNNFKKENVSLEN